MLKEKNQFGGIIESAYVYTDAGKRPLAEIYKGDKVLTDQRRFDVVEEIVSLSGISLLVSDGNHSVVVHESTKFYIKKPSQTTSNKNSSQSINEEFVGYRGGQELLCNFWDKPIVSETGYMAHEWFPIKIIRRGRSGLRFLNLNLRGANGFVADGVVIESVKR